MAIVLLRFVVGAHFFHEGYTKWRDPKPFTAPVFGAAKGPLAPVFQGQVWDSQGLHRLDEEATFRIWGVSFPEDDDEPVFSGGYLAKAQRHFGFTEEQASEAAGLLLTRVAEYRNASRAWADDINEYYYGLERQKANSEDEARQLESFKKHDARITKELTGKRMSWQTAIDKTWTGLEKDINELADRSGLASRGWLSLYERPGQTALDSRSFDRWIPYFDMTIGVLLVIGLFTRVAASVGAAFLATIVASQWPLAADAMPTGYQQVEMCAMLVLATIGAGKYAGLDALFSDCCRWCCRQPAK